MTSRTLVFPLYANISVNKKLISTCMVGIILSLIAISIIQVNAYTKEMYAVKQYGYRVAELQEETSLLEINLS
ncbi:MAG: hypothetical protein WC302_02130, partial [Candidatus Paceibacterota bacterium]